MEHYRRNINQSNYSHIAQIFNIGKEKNEFPIDEFSSLEEFCAKALRAFSPTFLRDAADGRRRSPIGDKLPLEGCYQQEFMRAFSEGLGIRGAVQCKWTGAPAGRVDFYIQDAGWAVELLREGDEVSITEHTDRFSCGRYQPWVANGSIRQWLVVDCRTSVPQDTCEGCFFPESRNLLI
jgi:hypothetical protein